MKIKSISHQNVESTNDEAIKLIKKEYFTTNNDHIKKTNQR